MMPTFYLQAVTVVLPAGFEDMQVEARAEGYRFLDRLAADWEAGTVNFDRDGEALVAAWHGGTLAGIGGITLDPAIPGVLRMRRFYVRAAFRRGGIGRALTYALLGPARQSGKPVLVNAGTTIAPAFWEALGFALDPDGSGHTHRFPSAV